MTYWTPKTLSDYLAKQGRAMSAEYIRRLCRQGRIRANKPSRDWVIEDSEAQEWIKRWLNT